MSVVNSEDLVDQLLSLTTNLHLYFSSVLLASDIVLDTWRHRDSIDIVLCFESNSWVRNSDNTVEKS